LGELSQQHPSAQRTSFTGEFWDAEPKVPRCAFYVSATSVVERLGEKAMLKTSVFAIALTILALSPANGQDLCNDAHMKKMDEMIAGMSDASKQKDATAALDNSKAAMEQGDTANCMKYMDEAHKAMGL
jgi:Na+/H+-translocating membrane pyrophosphatase